MGTHFIDYQQMIMQAYERKKLNNTLPHGLKHLTPANLKEECLKRCTKEVSRRDEKAIRDFCVDLKEAKDCHAIIQRCHTDKFRPLVNYLKGKSGKPDGKNIELLAWLIDFPGRPWELRKEISADEEVKEEPSLDGISQVTEAPVSAADAPENPPATGIDKPAGEPGIPEIPKIPLGLFGPVGKESEGVKPVEIVKQEEKLKGKSAKILAAAVMLSLVLGTGGMWWWKDKNQTPRSGYCMYWQEDHFEPVACNQKVSNARVIALDTMRLKNLRKITRPDTISYLAVGKVWYLKIDGKLEFYTSGGEHPVIFGRELRPITFYIIDKYIRSGMIANQ
ncbi:hypothetical protein ACTJJ0_12030 [Chitinophaga sp. 22321]|uniref:Uncharacterized protein n=1 Tax=Chitinophaga hostae TaxID=2831022 RepID=A0ABS5IX16_9BACT|nr:hypothetical protein [Chitinophaga hostae]MBS0027336.1 hypothetical protein [Chitinophaga hostae]